VLELRQAHLGQIWSGIETGDYIDRHNERVASKIKVPDRPAEMVTGGGGGASTARSTNRRSSVSSLILSDDTLILPKWIEAAQKRSIERNRRLVLSWDIARFGEDETEIMRREGRLDTRVPRSSQGRHDDHGWAHRQGHARHR
jgi:hypothetical protein